MYLWGRGRAGGGRGAAKWICPVGSVTCRKPRTGSSAAVRFGQPPRLLFLARKSKKKLNGAPCARCRHAPACRMWAFFIHK